jgi:hypothetical protein
MHESKWVRFVYAFALVWITVTWLETFQQMVGTLLFPRPRSYYPPLLVASSLVTAALVVPISLQRLVVALRGPGPQRVMPVSPLARAARFVGLCLLNLSAAAGALTLAAVVLAAALRGGGAILLGLSYLKPFATMTTPLTGVLLYETSRLLAYESACRPGG